MRQAAGLTLTAGSRPMSTTRGGPRSHLTVTGMCSFREPLRAIVAHSRQGHSHGGFRRQFAAGIMTERPVMLPAPPRLAGLKPSGSSTTTPQSPIIIQAGRGRAGVGCITIDRGACDLELVPAAYPTREIQLDNSTIRDLVLGDRAASSWCSSFRASSHTSRLSRDRFCPDPYSTGVHEAMTDYSDEVGLTVPKDIHVRIALNGTETD
jgi:hypothetical protein